ncbi:MAG TPA: hypothetical protein VH593_25905 [Ktedonobacteraceae bacterium]|jgi:hypothetical protein
MSREEFPHTHITDAQIAEQLQELQLLQRDYRSLADTPELRMIYDIRRAYQAETLEDARSLERVLTRLTGNQTEEAQSKVLSFPHVSCKQERKSTMQKSVETLTLGKSSRGWQLRAGLLAATLFFALLVGGLLTVLNIIPLGHTSTPPSSAVSQVITSATLSDNANPTGQNSTVQSFAVGQTVWLNSIINVGKVKGGDILTVKWYENNNLLATSKRGFQAPQNQAVATAEKVIPLRLHQVYSQPGDGTVQIYWNGQLAAVLHFKITEVNKTQK